jgi:hypothetical protein
VRKNTMTRADLAEMIRENTPAPRVDVRPIRGPMYAIAGAILLVALMLLPVAVLAVEVIYGQVKLYQAMEEHRAKK